MKTLPNITPEQKQAAKDVLAAMAFVRTIEPIVNGYRSRILNEMQVVDRHDDKLITDVKYDWTMSDGDFAVYSKRCNEARIAAGLVVESDDHCPLLVAEDLLRIANRHFIDVTYSLHKIKTDDVICAPNGLKLYAELIDLTLNLIVPRIAA